MPTSLGILFVNPGSQNAILIMGKQAPTKMLLLGHNRQGGKSPKAYRASVNVFWPIVNPDLIAKDDDDDDDFDDVGCKWNRLIYLQ